jgi:hypothetical protein
MTKGQKAQQSAQVEVPAVQSTSELVGEQRVQMLEGFADLVAEQYGYMLAKKEIQKEQNEKTAADRKKFSEAGKTISEKVELLIETPTKETADEIKTTRKERANIAGLLKKAREPFQEKAKPITAALKHIAKVAVPDALHYLGKTVVPRFTVSEEIQAGIEAEKAAKAAAL